MRTRMCAGSEVLLSDFGLAKKLVTPSLSHTAGADSGARFPGTALLDGAKGERGGAETRQGGVGGESVQVPGDLRRAGQAVGVSASCEAPQITNSGSTQGVSLSCEGAGTYWSVMWVCGGVRGRGRGR